MIIGTWTKHEIGERLIGDYSVTSDREVLAAFLIIGEATYEEWIEYRKSEGRYFYIFGEEHGHFWKVLTD